MRFTVKDAIAESERAIAKFQEGIDAIVSLIESWAWDDPVTQAYKDLFTDALIVDPDFYTDDFCAKIKERAKHNMPPGYRDFGKKVNSLGDVLIWETICYLAQQRKNDIIFVTEDTKDDWWSGSLYARDELVSEFSEVSGGKSFHLVRFERFLRRYAATKETVDEVHTIASESVPAAIGKDDRRRIVDEVTGARIVGMDMNGYSPARIANRLR